jgi:hypothetical protein
MEKYILQEVIDIWPSHHPSECKANGIASEIDIVRNGR